MLDAGALLELLLGTPQGRAVGEALRGHPLHAPDQVGAASVAALELLAGAGELGPAELERRLGLLAEAPIEWHPVAALLGEEARASGLLLRDRLCVELSRRLGAPLVTTDSGLATAWRNSWLVTAPGSAA